MFNELPKQYDPKSAQLRWSAFWDEKKYFHSTPHTVDPKTGEVKKPYTIVIPPPNVTGALHLGHALNDSLQDIMIRMKRMQGFEALWIPGVDHAGIATQAVVERQLFEREKKTRHDIGRDALIQRIWDWKNEYQARIINQLKEMGCSCDWERTRFTLDPLCAKAVRHFFFKLFQEQLIYRGKRLVNWDTFLQTAVSDDEVFHETVDGHFWHIRYPVVDPQPGEPEFLVVATTRPETMLGDTAIAVHPNPLAYLEQKIEELQTELKTVSEKDRLGVQAELDGILALKASEQLIQMQQYVQMSQEGRKVLLPLLNREIPIVLDIWAKPDKGTGCVKITPAHDPNDYEVGLRLKLEMINILNRDGTLNEQAGVYCGKCIKDARKMVVADLEEQGLLVKVEDRKIELAHSDRSKTPIEPFLNDQWFVKMEQLSQSAINAVENNEVSIIPGRYAKGYIDWLGEKRDWPIGRQLWWGHRIPIWYCQGASETDLKRAFSGRNDILWTWDEAKSEWWICSQEEDLDANAVPGFTFIQEEDVLDTWFSSALWPHSTLGWPDNTPELAYYYPTNVLITSRDIITLWVARMVLAGLFDVGEIPFYEVYIHPKILDKYGEGMSKSKGNGIDPISVMDKFGADALRFALAYLTTESQDVCLPLDFECPHCLAVVEQTKKNRILPIITCPKCRKDFATQWARTEEERALPQGAVVGERFEVARNFCNKIWNASRFVMMSFESGLNTEINRSDSFVPEMLEDKWILSRLATVIDATTSALDSYRFADAARMLYEFAWDEFCSFYVEMVKYRLADQTLRPVAQQVLVHVLDNLLRLLHPIIPFVTEEVWQRLGEFAPIRGLPGMRARPEKAAESIAIANWPIADLGAVDSEIESQFARFQDVLRAIRDIRARQNVPPKTEIRFSVRCEPQIAEQLRMMQPYFLSMSGAKGTGFGPEIVAPSLAGTVSLPGIDVFVDLADLIDVQAELAKKEKEIVKLEGFIKSKEAKLSNDSFVSKAPPEVIAKENESLADLKSQLSATQEAVRMLQSCSK
ncbi:MAG: valine--tRNA ligase [Thermoguttaceae bacterium]